VEEETEEAEEGSRPEEEEDSEVSSAVSFSRPVTGRYRHARACQGHLLPKAKAHVALRAKSSSPGQALGREELLAGHEQS
jgi:hypothetical protein